MLRIVNGLTLANLHGSGRSRALPGQSSYPQPMVWGHEAYLTAVNFPYLKLRTDPFLPVNNVSREDCN